MTPNSRFPRLAAPLVCMALLAGACGDGEQADATGRGVVDLATTTSEMPAETSSVAPPSSTTDAPQNTTAAPPSSSTTVASVPVDPGPVVIPVLFGDVELLEVVPDPDGGPGRLGERGEQDVYTLDVGDDQAILIEQLGICDFDGDDSLVIDVDGAGLNHSVVILEDGCRSASRFTSNATGTVTLTVRDSADEVIGDYSFRVVDVTDPEPIRLLAGDEVGPNSPVPGAGWVEHRGQRDIYLYDVADDESFLIEQIGGCDYDGGDFLAADVDGAGINSTAIFSEERCSLADRFTAKASGTVTIVVEDAGNDTFGTYAFRLTDVTDPAPIELVDGSEIMPAMEDGSGNLEARGMRDVYTYNATAGQAFVIEQLGVCDFEGSDNLVIDIDGAGINSSMSLREDRCDRVERFEPDEDGIVEIVVLSRGNDVWGTYSFALKEVS